MHAQKYSSRPLPKRSAIRAIDDDHSVGTSIPVYDRRRVIISGQVCGVAFGLWIRSVAKSLELAGQAAGKPHRLRIRGPWGVPALCSLPVALYAVDHGFTNREDSTDIRRRQ